MWHRFIRTAESVAEEILRGLEDGSIVLGNAPEDQKALAEDEAVEQMIADVQEAIATALTQVASARGLDHRSFRRDLKEVARSTAIEALERLQFLKPATK